MQMIDNIRDSGAQPQMQYQFEVTITGSLLGGGAGKKHTFRVNSVSIPEASVETVEVNFKNSKVMFAGRDSSPHSVTVSFWDDEGMEIYQAFQAWHLLIRDPVTGGGVPKSMYKGEMVIQLLNHDGTKANSYATFFNVWPQSIGDVTLSYETSDKVSFDVTFAYDEQMVTGVKGNNIAKLVSGVTKAASAKALF